MFASRCSPCPPSTSNPWRRACPRRPAWWRPQMGPCSSRRSGAGSSRSPRPASPRRGSGSTSPTTGAGAVVDGAHRRQTSTPPTPTAKGRYRSRAPSPRAAASARSSGSRTRNTASHNGGAASTAQGLLYISTGDGGGSGAFGTTERLSDLRGRSCRSTRPAGRSATPSRRQPTRG